MGHDDSYDAVMSAFEHGIYDALKWGTDVVSLTATVSTPSVKFKTDRCGYCACHLAGEYEACPHCGAPV